MSVLDSLDRDQLPIPVPLAGLLDGLCPIPLIGWCPSKGLPGARLLPGGYTNPDVHYHP